MFNLRAKKYIKGCLNDQRCLNKLSLTMLISSSYIDFNAKSVNKKAETTLIYS